MSKGKPRPDALLSLLPSSSTLREVVGELLYIVETLAKAKEPGEIYGNIKLLATKLMKALHSRHEFYFYITDVTVHPMIRLPRGVKLRHGKKDDLKHINLDSKIKSILRKEEGNNGGIIVIEAHKGRNRKTIGFSWITDNIPEDLRKFWKKRKFETYTKLTYIEEKYRKLGLLRNLVLFRDTYIRKQGKAIRLSLIETKNKRMNQIFQNTGKRPIAILGSVRILGIYKKTYFKEIN